MKFNYFEISKIYLVNIFKKMKLDPRALDRVLQAYFI